MKMTETKEVRLPGHVRPERYELVLKPNLEDFTFTGEETIHLRLELSVDEITLHADELEIEGVFFFGVSGERLTHSTSLRVNPEPVEGLKEEKISYDKKAETVTFSFNRPLPKGRGELRLRFGGILNDKMRGFYRSSYEAAGKTCYLATTQFEATDARRAFPCIDEPAVKAVFDITIIAPGNC